MGFDSTEAPRRIVERDLTGQKLLHYEVLKKLGHGGTGVVWKARDTHLDRFVALKTLRTEKVQDEDSKRRLIQEAKAASSLNHPNIVHIYDAAEADGVQYIAMEYVRGQTLDQLIGRKGLEMKDALKCAVQIAEALSKAHALGIIHRDLKPANVMIAEGGLVKVLDFGLAKIADFVPGESATTETLRMEESVGMIAGTIDYMSPEQAEGEVIDARSDIFSFGSTVYEMLTGKRAFHGDSKLCTLSAIIKEEPKPISSFVAHVPRDLDKIISRCLRKDPSHRFQYMADVKVALEKISDEINAGIAVLTVPPRLSLRAMVCAHRNPHLNRSTHDPNVLPYRMGGPVLVPRSRWASGAIHVKTQLSRIRQVRRQTTTPPENVGA